MHFFNFANKTPSEDTQVNDPSRRIYPSPSSSPRPELDDRELIGKAKKDNRIIKNISDPNVVSFSQESSPYIYSTFTRSGKFPLIIGYGDPQYPPGNNQFDRELRLQEQQNGYYRRQEQQEMERQRLIRQLLEMQGAVPKSGGSAPSSNSGPALGGGSAATPRSAAVGGSNSGSTPPNLPPPLAGSAGVSTAPTKKPVVIISPAIYSPPAVDPPPTSALDPTTSTPKSNTNNNNNNSSSNNNTIGDHSETQHSSPTHADRHHHHHHHGHHSHHHATTPPKKNNYYDQLTQLHLLSLANVSEARKYAPVLQGCEQEWKQSVSFLPSCALLLPAYQEFLYAQNVVHHGHGHTHHRVRTPSAPNSPEHKHRSHQQVEVHSPLQGMTEAVKGVPHVSSDGSGLENLMRMPTEPFDRQNSGSLDRPNSGLGEEDHDGNSLYSPNSNQVIKTDSAEIIISNNKSTSDSSLSQEEMVAVGETVTARPSSAEQLAASPNLAGLKPPRAPTQAVPLTISTSMLNTPMAASGSGVHSGTPTPRTEGRSRDGEGSQGRHTPGRTPSPHSPKAGSQDRATAPGGTSNPLNAPKHEIHPLPQFNSQTQLLSIGGPFHAESSTSSNQRPNSGSATNRGHHRHGGDRRPVTHHGMPPTVVTVGVDGTDMTHPLDRVSSVLPHSTFSPEKNPEDGESIYHILRKTKRKGGGAFPAQAPGTAPPSPSTAIFSLSQQQLPVRLGPNETPSVSQTGPASSLLPPLTLQGPTHPLLDHPRTVDLMVELTPALQYAMETPSKYCFDYVAENTLEAIALEAGVGEEEEDDRIPTSYAMEEKEEERRSGGDGGHRRHRHRRRPHHHRHHHHHSRGRRVTAEREEHNRLIFEDVSDEESDYDYDEEDDGDYTPSSATSSVSSGIEEELSYYSPKERHARRTTERHRSLNRVEETPPHHGRPAAARGGSGGRPPRPSPSRLPPSTAAHHQQHSSSAAGGASSSKLSSPLQLNSSMPYSGSGSSSVVGPRYHTLTNTQTRQVQMMEEMQDGRPHLPGTPTPPHTPPTTSPTQMGDGHSILSMLGGCAAEVRNPNSPLNFIRRSPSEDDGGVYPIKDYYPHAVGMKRSMSNSGSRVGGGVGGSTSQHSITRVPSAPRTAPAGFLHHNGRNNNVNLANGGAGALLSSSAGHGSGAGTAGGLRASTGIVHSAHRAPSSSHRFFEERMAQLLRQKDSLKQQIVGV